MEKELYNRLVKVADKANYPDVYPTELLNLTVDTMEAIRAHVLEVHPDRQGEIVIADTAIELVKGYR